MDGGAVTFELVPAKTLINAYKQICNAPDACLKAVNNSTTKLSMSILHTFYGNYFMSKGE